MTGVQTCALPSTLFPYTTLFRSGSEERREGKECISYILYILLFDRPPFYFHSIFVFFSSSFYESLHLLPVNFFDSPIRIRQTRLHESLHLLPVNLGIAYLSFSNSPALSRKYWSFFHISKWIANIMILFIIII